MKINEALSILTEWDRAGRYVYTTSDLAKILSDSTPATFRKTLARLVGQDILERVARGIYVFALTAHKGAYTLDEIALALRRGEYVFESLESALSQWGRISQIPIDRTTYMTTGRRGEYATPYGVAEFTHTNASSTEIRTNTIDRPNQRVPIATEEYALRNLKRVGRNVDLVREMDGEYER